MTRPVKNTVDYYQHDVTKSKSLKIMMNHFGDVGYRFWFELLAILGSTDNHCYEVKEHVDLEYIAVEAGTTPEKVIIMLHKLGSLSSIDQCLLAENKIWSQHFVDRLARLYSESRKRSAPPKPEPENKTTDYLGFPTWLSDKERDLLYSKPSYDHSLSAGIVLPRDNPHSIEEYSIVKDSNNTVESSVPLIEDDQPEEKSYSPVIHKILKILNDKIKDFRPTHKLGNEKSDLRIIDFMVRIDQRDTDEILEALEWYPIGEDFIPQIFGAKSLRQKYDNLVITMNKKKPKPKDTVNQESGSEWAEEVQDA